MDGIMWEQQEKKWNERDRMTRLIRALNTVMDAYAGEYGGTHTAWSADDLDWLELEPGDVEMPEGDE